LTHIKQQKFFLARQGPWIKYTVFIISTALDVPEIINVTYTVHLWLVGKRVVDFLLALIELFFASSYG